MKTNSMNGLTTAPAPPLTPALSPREREHECASGSLSPQWSDSLSGSLSLGERARVRGQTPASPTRTEGRSTTTLLLHALILVLFAFTSSAQEPAKSDSPTTSIAKPAAVVPLDLLRDKEVLALFSGLPVQEMGRVKPLDTVARFKLLRFSGKQSGISATRKDMEAEKTMPINDPATAKPLLDAKGKALKFSAMEWLLVSWFRPDIAKDLPVFVVDNSEAIIELALKAKGKRDRYTYNEIAPGRAALMRKMSELQNIEQKQRTPVQRAMGKLAFDFLDYEMMLTHFDFARAPFGEVASAVPPEIMAAGASPEIGGLLPKISAHIEKEWETFLKTNLPQGQKLEGEQRRQVKSAWLQRHAVENPWLGKFFSAMISATMAGNEATIPRFFPPPVQKQEVWHNPGTILKGVLEGTPITAEDTANLSRYGGLASAATDPAAFKAKLKDLHDGTIKLAAARHESGHVALELHYHRFDYFYKALLCFSFGLLLLALSWVKPGAGWGGFCRKACMLLTLGGTAFGTVGIVIRCLIMERPPITSLYETIIFITTTAAILALITEWITKKGWALAVASVAGTAGMFLSIRFMNMEARDTMELLEAVLITNFWLSTHVPIINLGYTAGMVSAIFSMIYIVMRVFGKVRHGDATAKDLTRMCYAFVLTGLFLSLVGTVLGGIWANYSWGRFWGWDPKENGALMIVLMNLVILHARMGGYIREAGFHCCGIILGMVVAFSWFATNQLGVGLHAYGAMDGAWLWLYIFWGGLTLLLITGMVLAFLDRKGPPSESKTIKAAEAAA